MPKPALFLDRDGVINIDHGYVHEIERFQFIEGIFDLVREAHRHDHLVVVVTNQSGIGRGYYSEQTFSHLTEWMCAEFASAGAPIDRVYHSPFHPTQGTGEYLKDDFSRKPHPGMLLRAAKELGIDLSRSVLVGDNESDIRAGLSGGVGRNILFSLKVPEGLAANDYTRISHLSHAAQFFAPLTSRSSDQ